MAKRTIARVPRLTPREKEVYSLLCRKIRFPLIYGHARAMYVACQNAVSELHGHIDDHPALADSIAGKVSPRAARLLHQLGIFSIQHLVDYDTLEFISDCQTHYLYDELIGTEIAKLKGRYQKILRAVRKESIG